jgi:soluble lytic murein transglycosylase
VNAKTRKTDFVALIGICLAFGAVSCGGSGGDYPPPQYPESRSEDERVRAHRSERTGAQTDRAPGNRSHAARNIPPSYHPQPHTAPAARPAPRTKPRPRVRLRDPMRQWTQKEMDRIYRVQRIVREASRANRIPTDLINGIIWVESKFQVKARGRKGPRGLMQIMPSTGRWLAKELGRKYRPYSPHFNIHAGTYYFSLMLKRHHGNVALALASYNAGPGVVKKWMEKKRDLPDETRSYVNKVLTAADAFRIRGI